MNVPLASLPVEVWVVLGVLAVAELALDVVALVNLARRPSSTVLFGNKWIWVAIILLVNLVGAILYLAIGRVAAPGGTVTSPAPNGSSLSAVSDALYGTRDTSAADTSAGDMSAGGEGAGGEGARDQAGPR